jgi:ADP-ribosyl-[dinitrogen reductase] hydrolase
MLGLAIGDALGQPFEFCTAKQIAQSGWDGNFYNGIANKFGISEEVDKKLYNLWKLNPGQYTDDTLLGLCIANSLVEHNDFVAEKVALNYMKYAKSGDLRGIGMTCEKAFAKMAQGVPLSECGKKESTRKKPSFKKVSQTTVDAVCGNGTVMRVASIGLFFKDETRLIQAAKEDASMTHDHPDARDTSALLALLINHLSKANDLNLLLRIVTNFQFEGTNTPNAIALTLSLLTENIQSFSDVIKRVDTGGCAHHTFGTALYCFFSSSSFKEAVIKAVLMGGDTDTRAAIVGTMAGTFYGLENISKEYVDNVENSKYLQELDIKLYLDGK